MSDPLEPTDSQTRKSVLLGMSLVFAIMVLALSFALWKTMVCIQVGINDVQKQSCGLYAHNATTIIVGTVGTDTPFAARLLHFSDNRTAILIPDSLAIIVVLLCGAFGGLVHSIRAFYVHIIERVPGPEEYPRYFLRPFSGAILALLFFLVMRAGLSQPNQLNENAGGSIVLYAAIAGLVGMFSDQTVEKLRKVAEAIFTTGDKSKPS